MRPCHVHADSRKLKVKISSQRLQNNDVLYHVRAPDAPDRVPNRESVVPIAMPVIPSTIVAVTIIASAVIAAAVIPVVIPVAPVWSVIPAVVGIPRIITVGIGVVISGSVEDRDWNGESKGKVNTGACRRFREERQSSDRKNEDNELLHKKETRRMYHEFKKSSAAIKDVR